MAPASAYFLEIYLIKTKEVVSNKLLLLFICCLTIKVSTLPNNNITLLFQAIVEFIYQILVLDLPSYLLSKATLRS